MAGNFHETCEMQSLRLDDGRFLRCLVRREDGEIVEAEIDLNCCIGNDNGNCLSLLPGANEQRMILACLFDFKLTRLLTPGEFAWGGESAYSKQLFPIYTLQSVFLWEQSTADWTDIRPSSDFSESADNIRVDIEAGQPILRAWLRRIDGEPEDRNINLTERIANRDGRLCFGK